MTPLAGPVQATDRRGAGLPAAPPRGQPRSRGEIAVGVTGGRLDRLRQAGCLKLRFPRRPGGAREGILLNTAGGLTGGDRLHVEASCAAGASLTLATQAAERVYRAASDKARVTNALTIGEGASLAWLPQETILYDGGALQRRLTVEAAGDARFLLCEPVILGRGHMGETVGDAELSESWRVYIDGRLVFAEAQRLAGDFDRLRASPAALGNARAFATCLLRAPEAEALMDGVRADIGSDGGASLIENDMLLVRLTAMDGADLRRQLVPALERLAGAGLPRVWSL